MIKVYALVKNMVCECELIGLTKKYGIVELLNKEQWRVPKDKISTDEQEIINLQGKLYSDYQAAASSNMIKPGNVIHLGIKTRFGEIVSDFKIIKVNKTRCLCEDLNTRQRWNIYKTQLIKGKLLKRA